MPKIQQRYDGFMPGAYPVDGFGAGGFTFAGMSHRGSILALPDGMYAWRINSFDQLGDGSLDEWLKDLWAQEPGSIETVLFGTGEHLQPLPGALRQKLHQNHMRADPMATTHAISTYNILLGENRKVAAALIAVA